ncbi:MAG: arginine repressor [Bacteroidota bacterium]
MKNKRHFAIKDIITHKQIANQDELRLQLKKRGIDVTQATLSRDLRDIGVGRISDGVSAHYTIQPEATEVNILRPIVSKQIIAVNANESIIVIKTLPGCASVVAEFLDALNNKNIIGTLAGDNTLLVIPTSIDKTKHLLEFLKQKLNEGL